MGRFHSALLTYDDLQGGTLYEVGLIQVQPQTLRMKVAIAWSGDPSEVLNPDYTLSNDMDLVVEKSTGEVIATSDSFDDSFETVDVLNPDPGFYVFKIHVDCGLQTWWEVCIAAGCNELLVRLVSAINPDPISDLARARHR